MAATLTEPSAPASSPVPESATDAEQTERDRRAFEFDDLVLEYTRWHARVFSPATGVDVMAPDGIHAVLIGRLAYCDARLKVANREDEAERAAASEERRRVLAELQARNCEPAGRCLDCGVILWRRPHRGGCGHAFDPNAWTTWGTVFHPPTLNRSGEVVEWFAAGEDRGQPCAPTPAMQEAAERVLFSNDAPASAHPTQDAMPMQFSITAARVWAEHRQDSARQAFGSEPKLWLRLVTQRRDQLLPGGVLLKKGHVVVVAECYGQPMQTGDIVRVRMRHKGDAFHVFGLCGRDGVGPFVVVGERDLPEDRYYAFDFVGLVIGQLSRDEAIRYAVQHGIDWKPALGRATPRADPPQSPAAPS